jgi:hypothetical protein
VIDKPTLRRIERHAEIHDVALEHAHFGITNCVVVGDEVACSSDLDTLPKSHPQYEQEKRKNLRLEEICASLSMQPVYIDLMEFEKSGAGLSCLVMHLNYANLDW